MYLHIIHICIIDFSAPSSTAFLQILANIALMSNILNVHCFPFIRSSFLDLQLYEAS